MKWKLYNSPKVRFGKGKINGVTYSPDGNRRAVASSIGILICDAHTGEELKLLSGHASEVLSVAYSPDGLTLASGSEDNTVRLWNVQNGQHKLTLEGHEDAVTSVVFSPDGGMLASGSKDHTIRLWEMESAYHKSTLEGHQGGVTSVVFNPKGSKLASGSDDGTVRLWESETRFGRNRRIATLREQQARVTSRVTSVVFSPDGLLFASGDAKGTICLWKLSNIERPISLREHMGTVYAIVFSPDGRTLASGSADNTIYVWDARAGQHFATLKGHTNGVFSVEFSPDGGMLISESYDSTIRFWKSETGENTKTLTAGYTGSVTSVALSSNGRTLVSVSQDRYEHNLDEDELYRRKLHRGGSLSTIRLWDAETGEMKSCFAEKTSLTKVTSVASRSNGRTLVSVSRNQDEDEDNADTVRLCDVETGKTKAEIANGVFSPNGRTIASVNANTVRLWDVDTGETKASFTAEQTDEVRLVRFSPDSQILATAVRENKGVDRYGYRVQSVPMEIHLWDANTGENKMTLSGEHSDEVISTSIESVVFSPDGRTLASVSQDEKVDSSSYNYRAKGKTTVNIRLWDANTGANTATLSGEHSDEVISTSIESVVFSPDGRTLASVSQDEKVDSSSYNYRSERKRRVDIRLWDVETGTRKASLIGEHANKTRTSICFSPDSRTLAAVSWNESRDVDDAPKISGGIVCLWDVESGQLKATLPKEPTNEVKSVVFSSNSETLLSLSEDRTIGLWDVETGKSKSTLAEEMANFQSISFSPDKAKFASVGSDSHIRVWDLETGNHKSTLRGPKEHMGRVTTVAFSADGRMLASGSEDGTVLLWELTE